MSSSKASATSSLAALSHGHVILPTGHYLAYPKPIGRSKLSSHRFLPVTVLATSKPRIDFFSLVDTLKMLDEDDVFTDDFCSNIIFCQTSATPIKQYLEQSTEAWLRSARNMKSFEIAGAQSWPSGPYFVSDGILYQAWRLYPDETEAFYFGTVPDPDDPSRFLPLSLSAFEAVGTVAVPSHLHYPRNTEKPLNGLRLAVKDIFDLNGVRTAASNRSFRDLYPPRTKTAGTIQRLIDQGAIIVGKTKTTTFADRELATSDWIDTHSPFNPRGDGYIWGGGSSTGSAAAVAAYDWLDFAVGIDTSGSARGPAASHGIYGIRPTWQCDAMEGVVPSSLAFDTPAFFTRDIELAEIIARSWYGPHLHGSTSWRPRKILWPSDYCDPDSQFVTMRNEEVHAKFEHFVTQLEKFLGVKRSVINLREWWKKSFNHPQSNFDDYFRYTYEAILNRDSYKNNIGFVKDYEEAFGRHPYLPPSILNRWIHGKTITDRERGYALDQVSNFKTWFEEDVLGYDGTNECSTIMVMPWTVGTPDHRDLPRTEPNVEYGYGFQPAYMSTFIDGPEFVFPIGTWTYYSRVSQREERLPVAAGLLTAEGLDHKLLELAAAFLRGSDLPKTVFAGREMLEPDVKMEDKKS